MKSALIIVAILFSSLAFINTQETTAAPSEPATTAAPSGPDTTAATAGDNSAKQKQIADLAKKKYVSTDLSNTQIGSQKFDDIYTAQLMKTLAEMSGTMNANDYDKLIAFLG